MTPLERASVLLNISAVAREAGVDRRNLARDLSTGTTPPAVERAVVVALRRRGILLDPYPEDAAPPEKPGRAVD